MSREFTRNMFIMLVSIMVGVVIITVFVGDIISRSRIETLSVQHNVEIGDITSRNENFTNYFLQGSVKMDSAREVREVANYYFDFALYWFNTALTTSNMNITKYSIENCTVAMEQYMDSFEKFGESKPLFENATLFTNNFRYLEALRYYIGFSLAGQNITILRYNASDFLKRAAENLSFGNTENVTQLMENFTIVEQAYQGAQGEYQEYRDKIDGYIFFSTVREVPDQQ